MRTAGWTQGTALALVAVGALAGSVATAEEAPAPALLLEVQPLATVTCPPKPLADPCEVLTCKSGEWMSTPKASGTACGNDGDPCTYGGKCNGTSLQCPNVTSYSCQPLGPCWSAACNGTGGCIDAPLPAGTASSACTARGPCESSACNGGGACGYTPRPAGTVCGYTSEDGARPNPCGDSCNGSSYKCGP